MARSRIANAFAVQGLDPLDDEGRFQLRGRERAGDRLGALRSGCSQHLFRSTQPRHEAIREPEHLGR